MPTRSYHSIRMSYDLAELRKLYQATWEDDLATDFTDEDKKIIIETYDKGGLLIPYEDIKAYNPIRKFVYKGLFFYYEITDMDCPYYAVLMPTRLCEKAVKILKQMEANRKKIVGKQAQFLITDDLVDYKKPTQRASRSGPALQQFRYVKPKQRK